MIPFHWLLAHAGLSFPKFCVSLREVASRGEERFMRGQFFVVGVGGKWELRPSEHEPSRRLAGEESEEEKGGEEEEERSRKDEC